MHCLLECSLQEQPATTEWRHLGNLQKGPTRKRINWQNDQQGTEGRSWTILKEL